MTTIFFNASSTCLSSKLSKNNSGKCPIDSLPTASNKRGPICDEPGTRRHQLYYPMNQVMYMLTLPVFSSPKGIPPAVPALSRRWSYFIVANIAVNLMHAMALVLSPRFCSHLLPPSSCGTNSKSSPSGEQYPYGIPLLETGRANCARPQCVLRG